MNNKCLLQGSLEPMCFLSTSIRQFFYLFHSNFKFPSACSSFSSRPWFTEEHGCWDNQAGIIKRPVAAGNKYTPSFSSIMYSYSLFIVHHNVTSAQLDRVLKMYRNKVSSQVYDWVKKGRVWCPEGVLLWQMDQLKSSQYQFLLQMHILLTFSFSFSSLNLLFSV